MKVVSSVLMGTALSTTLLLANTQEAKKTSEVRAIDDLGMNISHSELEAIESAMHSAKKISRVAETINGRPFRRDAHAKATGCVRATFTVNGDIPSRYRYSVFSEPGKEYKAWVRFSNGDMLVKPDRDRDARGMAIKVMGVNGERIAPELNGAKTQDFVMANTAAFFNRNVFDYAEDISYLAKFQRTKWFISLFPPRFHPKQLFRAIQTVSSRIETPFAPQYFSILPYQLGNTVLKFSVKPCPGTAYPKALNKDNPDYLTEQMANTLADGAACFDFMVQPKIPGVNMPIDDATYIWSEKDSPFIPIARVDIPPQRFTGEPQQQFCEDISMNPWNGVGQWQPEGSLNRARRIVYNEVSKYRHHKNQVQRKEPDSWCIQGADSPCTPTQGLVITPPKWPLPRYFDNKFRPINGEVKSYCNTADKVAGYNCF